MERAGSSVVEIFDRPIAINPPPGQAPYFATLIGGLEAIVVDELKERLPDATVLGALQGKVFFSTVEPPKAALELRTIENLFAYIDQMRDLPRTASGLNVIEQWLAGMDLEAALEIHGSLHGPRRQPSFRITGVRSGEHDYTSIEIGAAAGAGVVESYGWDVDLTGYDYDIRVYVGGDTAMAGLRLTPEALDRRSRVRHGRASLNTTIAHAMCRLTAPREGEVVLDPMCGSGTTLIERASLATPELLIGGDRFAAPLELARTNVDAAGVYARLMQWDARRLALATDSVDTVICNLPWGRRIGSHRANRHLYPGFVRELERVLRADGVAALLTQEKRLITRLIDRNARLQIIREDHLSVSGTNPTIYMVRRA